jgi:hypothetical protein
MKKQLFIFCFAILCLNTIVSAQTNFEYKDWKKPDNYVNCAKKIW